MEEGFQGRKPKEEELLKFGFELKSGAYEYRREIVGGLMLCARVEKGELTTRVFDPMTDEDYVLHLIEGASGSFVGEVRREKEKLLKELSTTCFDRYDKLSDGARALFDYAERAFGVHPEYLWADTPDCAVLRRPDTKKWFAAVLTVRRDKLFLAGEGKVEVVDVRARPEEIPLLIENSICLPGYHMNKKHWITFLLDGSVSSKLLQTYLVESYSLAKK